jgi:restriction system protein
MAVGSKLNPTSPAPFPPAYPGRSSDKASMTQVPTYDQLMVPLFTALRGLGGSASIAEIDEKVGELLALPEETLELPHNPEKSNQTEFQYRLAWARTYLKQYGLIDNSQRGVWVIAPDKRGITDFDPQEVVRDVREQHRRNREERSSEENGPSSEIDVPDETEAWRQTLHRVLTEIVDPAAFERLIQRLLRESGFIHVEVTGRSGDGGVDGKGIARMSGLLSFHVIFQCKRYVGSVSASHVRDFRGAMVGRADKGLLITTGTFTRDAIREATRDGAPPLDLIDGEQLADMLKNLGLGISTEVVEKVSVDEDWFRTI